MQHAHNPVDWFPWGEEALRKAAAENKPLLVSIGYAACHWCHVMERESFEDEEIARVMNEHFVNVKIDREERPDLDHIYMDAVQAITGSGGWPLNVFLTPAGKPFYGGTYFPPRPLHNRPSWKEVLQGIAAAFKGKRGELEDQAEALTAHLAKSHLPGLGRKDTGEEGQAADPDRKSLRSLYENIMKSADRTDGGFGHAPKFPQTFIIQFLLHYHYFTGEAEALEQACLSLDKMILGGIYDQVGGGFSRYSTDGQWLVPHFEKMLYDNALLVIVCSEAWQITKKELYRETILQTMEFIGRELRSPEGAFYTALDADSEGEEGKYYVWEKEEVDSILGSASELFCAWYGITGKGNWEGRNILHRPVPVEVFLKDRGFGSLDREEVEKILSAGRAKLLEYRCRRVRPGLDDKILLGWNALMNSACSKAYAALGVDRYREWAVVNMDFLLGRFQGVGIHRFYHSYKEGQAKFPAFLDDYAYLVSALIQLQEITGEPGYLLKAREIYEFIVENFSEKESDFFFYTHRDQKDVIIRKKEIFDGATPSGNSVMAFNLYSLSVLFDEPDWARRADGMVSALTGVISGYPVSFGLWATFKQALTYVIPEVVITGRDLRAVRNDFLSKFVSYRVYQSATVENTQFPLLRGKPVEEHPLIFLCENYTCQLPVNEVDVLIRNLENVQKFKD